MHAIRPAASSDAADIRDLLTAAGLPTADLADSPVEFLIAEIDGTVVGAAGLESHARDGLLRSLVVAPLARGAGIGAALAEAIENLARSRGIVRLVLLTETAGAFFAARGYVPAQRTSMPAAIAATAEFRSLCPSSALCLSRDLPPP